MITCKSPSGLLLKSNDLWKTPTICVGVCACMRVFGGVLVCWWMCAEKCAYVTVLCA